jgi:hypothetical protein
LHAEDVGKPRIEFRSRDGVLVKGDSRSLQVVINLRDGRFYADLDLYNPHENLGGLLKHNIVEVWGPKLKRLFTKKKDA